MTESQRVRLFDSVAFVHLGARGHPVVPRLQGQPVQQLPTPIGPEVPTACDLLHPKCRNGLF
jgi:hypothetical protein